MTQRVQQARSSVTRNRPGVGTRPVGELFVNFSDFAIGFIDASKTAQDLLPIRKFSATAQYLTDELIAYNNRLYRAKANNGPAAFAYGNWLGISDALNVMDFGAKVDGTTDDGAAINAALGQANADALMVMPHGTGAVSYSGITAGPATPVYWQVHGVTSGGLPVQVFGNRPDLVENVVGGVKHLYNLRAPVDHPGVLIIDYKTLGVGGTTGFTTTPLRINATDAAGTVNAMFAAHIMVDSYSTTPAASHTSAGLNVTANKRGFSGLQGIHVSAFDWLNVASSTGGPYVCLEMSQHANGADDYGNAAIFGGQGGRAMFHLSQQRHNALGAVADFAAMFNIDGDSTQAVTKSVFLTNASLRSYQILDTRAATTPAGYADPLAAVRMSTGQIIDFSGGTALNSGAGKYLQYTTTGGARLRYMAGAFEAWSISDTGGMKFNGTGPATAFGTDVSEVPLFENYQASGFAGLGFPSRFIVYKSGATSENDFATMNVIRSSSHSGGAVTSVATGLRVTSGIGAGVSNQEWAFLSSAVSSSTVGGLAVGGVFQGQRLGGSNAPIWGGIFNAIDQTGLPSGSVSGGVLGGEIDIRASGADNGANGAKFGGIGLRQSLQFNIVRQDHGSDLQVSHGLWFGAQEPTYATYMSVIGFAVGTQTYQVLDTRGAVAPSGGILAAVRMSTNHVIDFSGGAALDSAVGRYLQYTTSGTARLRYGVGAAERWSVDDTGNMQVGGALGVTGNVNVSGSVVVTGDLGATNGTFTTWVTGGTVQGSSQVLVGTGSGQAKFVSDDTNSMWQFRAGDQCSLLFQQGTGNLYFRGADGTPHWTAGNNGDFTIQGQGWKPGGGSWGDSSDRRIKDVLAPYTRGLDDLLKLKLIIYRFKGNDTIGGSSLHHFDRKLRAGLVAQEAEEHWAELVTLAHGTIDGEPVDDIRLLDPSDLIYAVINALHTFDTRINILEDQLP